MPEKPRNPLEVLRGLSESKPGVYFTPEEVAGRIYGLHQRSAAERGRRVGRRLEAGVAEGSVRRTVIEYGGNSIFAYRSTQVPEGVAPAPGAGRFSSEPTEREYALRAVYAIVKKGTGMSLEEIVLEYKKLTPEQTLRNRYKNVQRFVRELELRGLVKAQTAFKERKGRERKVKEVRAVKPES